MHVVPARAPGGLGLTRVVGRPALVAVAIGGNALADADGAGGLRAALERSLPPLVDLLRRGQRLVLTHGNGPQVGETLLRMELTRQQVGELSLDVCVAETQGSIGYAIQQTLGNLCVRAGLRIPVASIVTRVLVDPLDPAFRTPTKPVGPAYDEAEAARLAAARGWRMVHQAGRGHRRAVPSPRPVEVLETEVIGRLVESGVVPVACGGGGVPVVSTPAGHRGVEAVVDKDLATALLADRLGATVLLNLTAVDRVALQFGTPAVRWLDRLAVAEARAGLAAGEFPAGSMGPKVEAAVRFVEGDPSRRAIITSLDRAAAALEGRAGTHVVA